MTAKACKVFVFASLLLLGNGAGAAPKVGDVYVYQVVNAYNHEVRGQLAHRVESTNGDQVSIVVSPDQSLRYTRQTEVFDKDGNWLRHSLVNHDFDVDYDFSPAYPAYVLPLQPGTSWSVRVNATQPTTGHRNSVRVDGKVVGSERITTPAGTFDTIKIKRMVYAGDWGTFTSETNIVELEWFAPELQRAVRIERSSGYLDPQKCAASSACTAIRGDADVIELVRYERK